MINNIKTTICAECGCYDFGEGRKEIATVCWKCGKPVVAVAPDTWITYEQALNGGYIDYFDSWQRGYESRQCNIDDLPVEIAGGKRYGLPYVLRPSWRSTQYCIRQYLQKDIKN